MAACTADPANAERLVVLDRATFPRHKPCGGALSRRADARWLVWVSRLTFRELRSILSPSARGDGPCASIASIRTSRYLIGPRSMTGSGVKRLPSGSRSSRAAGSRMCSTWRTSSRSVPRRMCGARRWWWARMGRQALSDGDCSRAPNVSAVSWRCSFRPPIPSCPWQRSTSPEFGKASKATHGRFPCSATTSGHTTSASSTVASTSATETCRSGVSSRSISSESARRLPPLPRNHESRHIRCAAGVGDRPPRRRICSSSATPMVPTASRARASPSHSSTDCPRAQRWPRPGWIRSRRPPVRGASAAYPVSDRAPWPAAVGKIVYAPLGSELLDPALWLTERVIGRRRDPERQPRFKS